MDCRKIEKSVADFLQGNLTPEFRSEVERHLRGCNACRILVDVASGKLDLLPPSSQHSLTTSIMERTSGPACGRAREMLCGFVDGALSKPDAHLVSRHLEYCAECYGIASSLIELDRLLPSFAGIMPDAGFTAEVVRATVEQHNLQPGPRARIREWWITMVQRPRFSFEAAYLGTLVLVLLVGNPFPGMRALSVHTVQAISRFVPADQRNDKAGFLRSLESFAVDLSDREHEFRRELDQVRVKGETFVSGEVRSNLRSIGSGCDRALSAMRGLWQRVWSGNWRSSEPKGRV